MGMVFGLGGGAGGMTSRQNRVWPTGEIVANPARGMFMGNRGCLHDHQGQLGTARWRHKNWITCALSFKGRKRHLMAPGSYTELFFMDESVACAAGHRPCAECRRSAWQGFQAAWAMNFGKASAADIDRSLHLARLEAKDQRRHQAVAKDLPDGVMVLLGGLPHLVLGGQARSWRPDGYGADRLLPDGSVTVLTPAPMVAVMGSGWRPELHSSIITGANL